MLGEGIRSVKSLGLEKGVFLPFLKVIIQHKMNVMLMRICLRRPRNECLQFQISSCCHSAFIALQKQCCKRSHTYLLSRVL